jgi:light-regulated signal transduction histidine kinase (bacteriophytochrome)
MAISRGRDVLCGMEETQIPCERVAAFIRQHTHDVRNDLNSIDLESSLLQEIVPSGDARDGVDRIRRQVRSLAQKLRSLSAHFHIGPPIAGPMPASSLLSIWRERHGSLAKAPEVQWQDKLKAEQVSVDVQMMAEVFQELLTNALTHGVAGPIIVSARSDEHGVTFEMREPKAKAVEPTNWGQPFHSNRRGNYGLGLWTARRLVEANKGTFVQRYLPEESVLLTQIVLPKAG